MEQVKLEVNTPIYLLFSRLYLCLDVIQPPQSASVVQEPVRQDLYGVADIGKQPHISVSPTYITGGTWQLEVEMIGRVVSTTIPTSCPSGSLMGNCQCS